MSGILFVLLLVVHVFIWCLVFSYMAHCFVTVVEDTAAGIDQFTWPNDIYLDWIWKPVYLLWLICVWLVPVALLFRVVRSPVLETQAPQSFLIVAAASLWLLFPFGLLSSLAASSRWLPFSVIALRLLVRRPGTVAVFYLFSGVIVTVCTACFCFALLNGSTALVLAAGAIGAAGLLIYARLLGRLLRVLRGVQLPVTKQVKPATRHKRINPYPELTNPTMVSAEELNKFMKDEGPVVTIPLDGPVESYGIADYAPPSSEKKRKKKKVARPARSVPIDGPAEPYPVAAHKPESPPQKTEELTSQSVSWDEATPTERLTDSERLALHQPSEAELELARRSREPSLPPLPLVNGVFTFPWSGSSVLVWLALSMGLIVLQGLALLQIALWPG
jgi:hypothetical protein